jgi:hypothetical protein
MTGANEGAVRAFAKRGPARQEAWISFSAREPVMQRLFHARDRPPEESDQGVRGGRQRHASRDVDWLRGGDTQQQG